MKPKVKVRYTFRIHKNGVVIQRYDSSSIRRFKNHIRTIKWQNKDFKVYLKANYSNGYYNDGYYENLNDLLFALEAFADPWIIKHLYG